MRQNFHWLCDYRSLTPHYRCTSSENELTPKGHGIIAYFRNSLIGPSHALGAILLKFGARSPLNSTFTIRTQTILTCNSRRFVVRGFQLMIRCFFWLTYTTR
jgi:hypothetical protein